MQKRKKSANQALFPYRFFRTFVGTVRDNMDEETRNKVLDNMTTERDLRNQMAYARKEGLEQGLQQGLEQGKVEAARNFKTLGVDLKTIAKATGLSMEQIEAL